MNQKITIVTVMKTNDSYNVSFLAQFFSYFWAISSRIGREREQIFHRWRTKNQWRYVIKIINKRSNLQKRSFKSMGFFVILMCIIPPSHVEGNVFSFHWLWPESASSSYTNLLILFFFKITFRVVCILHSLVRKITGWIPISIFKLQHFLWVCVSSKKK